MCLLEKIIDSYEVQKNRGIPLGNLTSQLFSNIYLNPLDQYMKRIVRAKINIRYADDMLLAHTDKDVLLMYCDVIRVYLNDKLKLLLHPHKTTIRKWHQGIDFLGYVSFPTHCVVRTSTKRRLLKRLNAKNAASYLGVARHARAYDVEREIYDILEV